MKTICKIMPLRDFKHNGEEFTQGHSAYIDETTAHRWVRDGFVEIKELFDIQTLCEPKNKKTKES